ncbi:MAG: hypothetical protein IJI35_08380 [Kiritimatiellae bacterium]|nr:hypothetical protein [Kiritimatiellia bacterium]MBQ6329013.1 hypothetical protein [Kiritimatiellia bacterium]
MVNARKVMMRLACFVALTALALVSALLFFETRRLREQIQLMEGERDQAVLAEFRRDWRSLPEGEKARVVGIYNEVAQAYANRDAMAMHMAMLKLPQINDQQTWQWAPDVDSSFYAAFTKTFLLAEKLSDFDSPEQFAEYLQLNIEAALFLGGAYARRQYSEYSSYVEYQTLYCLKQYEAKFDKEGKAELRDVAAKALSFWIAWIESPNGFTRQCAHWMVRANSDYARLVKPELALTRERAMSNAYAYAKTVLSRSGYTPSWLSEFQVQGTNSATTGAKGQ